MLFLYCLLMVRSLKGKCERNMPSNYWGVGDRVGRIVNENVPRLKLPSFPLSTRI
jgi:hypothetical protein